MLQVIVESPQLAYQEHSLVHNGAAGEGGDIGADVTLLKFPPDDIEQPVKGKAFVHLGRAPHKALQDAGHGLPGSLSQNIGTDGYLPPAEELHAVPPDNDFQHLSGLQTLQGVLGKEKHSDTVAPGGTQIFDAGLSRGFHHESVGNLHHQANAVTGLAAGVLSGTVLQLLHDLQSIVHGAVALYASDHSPDAAGIMLKTRVVERENGRVLFHGSLLTSKGPPAFSQAVL